MQLAWEIGERALEDFMVRQLLRKLVCFVSIVCETKIGEYRLDVK